MKIAILTQPLHTNYGGNLQNYALQQVLKRMGHDPLTIDFHHPVKIRTRLKLGYLKRLVYHYLKGAPKPKLRDYFSMEKPIKDKQHVTRFIEQHINKTPRLYSDKAVRHAFSKNNFDAVVVGSDQCWRPMYSPRIDTYFLDFLVENDSIKKIAYAASFGTDHWEFDERETRMASKLIRQFDAISVREKQAVDLVTEKLDSQASFVLDPTMLLSQDDYQGLIELQRSLPDRKGIYTYVLDTDGWKGEVINSIVSQLDLEVYNNQPKADRNNPSDNEDDYIIPSVEGWIKGFADADFVITDSFHGTVFSIIFNKPFISLLNSNRGASRFHSLLSEFGLENRLVTSFSEEQVYQIQKHDIDWQQVNIKLAELQQVSCKFLEGSLKG